MNARRTIIADVWPVHLDTTAMMFKLGNQVCPVTIKFEGYNDRKSDRIPWLSDFFYTHNKGYKMCLEIYASGHGSGEDTHLSVYLYLMKGSYDDGLMWPLEGKFETKLYNQIEYRGHHSVVITYGNTCADRVTQGEISKKGWDTPKFISNEDLDKSVSIHQYLKDDCLFLQVKFEA